MATNENDALSTNVELNIACSHLVSLDVTSKSDPLTIAFLKGPKDSNWIEIGRTEMIKNESNPKFATPVALKYFFEEVQNLRFLVVDIDNPNKSVKDIEHADIIGEMTCTVGDIFGSATNSVDKPLTNSHHPSRKNGDISVRGLQVGNNNISVNLHFMGVHLDKKDFFGKSDPFLIIHRGNDMDGRNFTPVHKTEIIKNTLEPVWKEFSLPLNRICGGNLDLPIMLEVWDWDSDGSNDLIGRATTTFKQLKVTKSFPLIEPEKKRKGGDKYKNSGELQLIKCEEVRIPSFLEYVTGGTEISLIAGIDFTGSNGDPKLPTSLHYRNPNGPNEYMAAIRIIGDVVAAYDNDKLFPVFGFGGSFKGETHHCFSLTGDEQNPNCFLVDGILNAYVNAFNWVSLSGPTNFAPIIDKVASLAQPFQNGEKYFILLMITDGEITDMANTVRAIGKASELPISIIIVGVGSANFDKMNTLDNDDGSLPFKRDIVQFVPFRNYGNADLARLAKDTLAEVPKQLVSYMTMRKIAPRPPPQWPGYVPQ